MFFKKIEQSGMILIIEVMKIMNMTLGDRIRKSRKGKMTQAELAEAIGVHEITVRRWELGERFPDIGALQKISSVLGVPLIELTGDVNSKKNNSNNILSNNATPQFQTMTYWGGVSDNIQNLLASGDEEKIAYVAFMLKGALYSVLKKLGVNDTDMKKIDMSNWHHNKIDSVFRQGTVS